MTRPICTTFMGGLDDGPWLPGHKPRKRPKNCAPSARESLGDPSKQESEKDHAMTPELRKAATTVANAARRALADTAVSAIHAVALQDAVDGFDAALMADLDAPAPERFTRLPDEKLVAILMEEVQKVMDEIDGRGADAPMMVIAGVRAMKRIALYCDHLRGVMKMLADNVDLESLVYKARDQEQLGWDGPKVKAVGLAVAEVLAEVKADKTDG